MSTIISAGQSLADVCLQQLGTLDALFALADANGLSISDALAPGQVLQVPATVLSQPQVAAYFSGRAQRINTGNGLLLPTPPPEKAAGIFDKTFPKPPFN